MTVINDTGSADEPCNGKSTGRSAFSTDRVSHNSGPVPTSALAAVSGSPSVDVLLHRVVAKICGEISRPTTSQQPQVRG